MNPRSLTSVLMRTIVIISDDCKMELYGQQYKKSRCRRDAASGFNDLESVQSPNPCRDLLHRWRFLP